MANMSYCRFRNTLGDLTDCCKNMDGDDDDRSLDEDLARLRLIRLCVWVTERYGYEVGVCEVDEVCESEFERAIKAVRERHAKEKSNA